MAGQWYGRATDLARTKMPGLPSNWGEPQQQYVQENPGDFNAWVLQQPGYTQSDLGQQFYGWLQTWLGGRPTAFGGYKVDHPEAHYEDWLLGQNPWQDYSQQNRPTTQAATFFGPRLQQR
jgi:hypothetical protein